MRQAILLTCLKLGGQQIRHSEPIIVMLGCVNCALAQFAAHDTLGLTRNNSRCCAFGYGVHHCVSAPLARLEGHIARNSLVPAPVNLRLAAPADALN